jgi:dimethylaniline monooxygenase (N-oxide forming)
VVIFATGYHRSVNFIDHNYPRFHELNVRGIFNRDDVSVGFIGFVRPGIGWYFLESSMIEVFLCLLGAIPPLAELQAQLWVLRLLEEAFPDVMADTLVNGIGNESEVVAHYELDYALKSRGTHDLFGTKHGIEQESYAYQLALDMGAAPTFKHVWSKGYKVFYTWAMGPNFNTKFRLVGPWKWSGAASIMADEQYRIVKRTGGGVCMRSLPYILQKKSRD